MTLPEILGFQDLVVAINGLLTSLEKLDASVATPAEYDEYSLALRDLAGARDALINIGRYRTPQGNHQVNSDKAAPAVNDTSDHEPAPLDPEQGSGVSGAPVQGDQGHAATT